jgi:hypothetical protein
MGAFKLYFVYPVPGLPHTVKSRSGFEPFGTQQPTIATATRPEQSMSCALMPENPPTTLPATIPGLASQGGSKHNATLQTRCVAHSLVFMISSPLPDHVIAATMNGPEVPPTPTSQTKRCAAPAKTTRPKADVKILFQRLHHPPCSIMFAPLHFQDTAQPS